ncbi:MAG TPA: hypothetical protein VKH37_02595, partial [Ferruginibacter sp.]|nr:hypothetical protein [Ferruginibacter sp.]
MKNIIPFLVTGAAFIFLSIGANAQSPTYRHMEKRSQSTYGQPDPNYNSNDQYAQNNVVYNQGGSYGQYD